MRRVAIVGGGLSGLATAYELIRRAREGAGVEFTLYEATSRPGGTIETVYRDGFTIECGPDGWVSEKPWARELAAELGLGDQLIGSNDAGRKTHIYRRGRLRAMPDGMRMMVPTNLDAVARSDLFSRAAVRAYREEQSRGDVLRATAPADDESIASFTRRHFGSEVLETVAAPLLSGVFGGDVRRLSVRTVMASFVALEREHGSLVRGLQMREAGRGKQAAESIFTTLRGGLGVLVDALASHLPERSLLRNTRVVEIRRDGSEWVVCAVPQSRNDVRACAKQDARSGDEERFDAVVFATPLAITRGLLEPLDRGAARLLPARASSAIIVALAWSDARVHTAVHASDDEFRPPAGFGFLVPPSRGLRALFAPRLLAATFVEQKFADRVPAGGRLLRAFFGGVAARSLQHANDDQVTSLAMRELRAILGPLPTTTPFAVVRRWPDSLPQYEVGHLARVTQLERRLDTMSGLHVLGNLLHGVGIPDLIRDARALAQRLVR